MNRCIIIGEAGVNHNGSIDLAKRLIDAAVDAGVDYVKFQTFKAEKLVSKNARKASYQQANLGDGNSSQYTMLKQLELNEENHLELIQYAKRNKIRFLSTAFDEDGIDFLDSLELDMFKIPSGEITNLPYLKKIAEKKKPTIVSTGMATLKEIESALSVLYAGGLSKEEITVLHCNTEYPTPYEDVNLKAMLAIQSKLNVKVGYSDHTMGIEVPIAAVAMGATCIEKHFTLDRSMKGPDHKASLEPGELRDMVRCIRNIELAVGGSGLKIPSPSEIKNISAARKSIHFKLSLPAGHIIEEKDLIMKRPGDGISPMDVGLVIGKSLKLAVEADDMIHYHQIQ